MREPDQIKLVPTVAAQALAHPCTAETIWGPVGGLVIEDVGVRDKSPLEIPSISTIILL